MKRRQVFDKKAIIWLLLLSGLFFSGLAVAQGDKGTTENASNPIGFSSTAPLTIRADRLQMKNEDASNRNAVYSGNVLVQQAKLTIQADKLNMLSKGSKVQYLKAEGNPVYVKNTEEKNSLKAKAKQIIYDIKSGWLELSGGTPEIIHNKNQINGSRIRYNLNSKDIEAEGHKDRPALLVIDPNSQ